MNDTDTPRQDPDKRAGLIYLLLAACVILAVATLVFGLKVQTLNADLASNQKQVADAKAQTDLVQADLAKAKATCATLQTQADTTKAACTDLQSQLEKAKSEKAVVEAWLAKTKAENSKQVEDMRAQIDKANAQCMDVQAQLAKAASDSALTAQQLEQAKGRCNELAAKLQKAEMDLAKVQPFIVKARQLPVTTACSRSSWAGGMSTYAYTMQIHNQLPTPLKLAITIEGPEGTRTLSNLVDSGASMKIEKLAAKEKVTLASEAYDPIVVVVE